MGRIDAQRTEFALPAVFPAKASIMALGCPPDQSGRQIDPGQYLALPPASPKYQRLTGQVREGHGCWYAVRIFSRQEKSAREHSAKMPGKN
jgi:hypothetical protein